MVSRLVARSGISVCLIAELIDWVPDQIFQVGIGTRPEEVVIFKEAWPDVEISGCEPHPQIVENIRDDYPGKILELALSDYIGKGTLHAKKRHKDGSSLYKLEDQETHEIPIFVSTLDQVYQPKSNKTLLWLDCEGSELAVLKQGLNCLAKTEVVNVEMTAKPWGKEWCSSVQVHQFLIDRGFRLQWIHTQRSSAGQSDLIYVRPYLFKPEYCCCPYELMREI